ncbi:Predicted metalloprotease, contains C-terminal PDZ domain [Maribacter dokdonensis]|uniref:Predicted metalloprotease, contains C-terminal PDZ domain n=1 Tax=Maribacter dokdonensis TaxID=320912 RepID=A0ABY0USY1_9FLAO|nr:peptidase M61 [Maribacter dokdonensis]SDT12781.1 Predicted metalloprotease, contains C-terminal PDZ domain [Maribacter dokdonensis]
MKKSLLIISSALLLYACGAGKQLATIEKSPVLTSIDLVNVVEDRVQVIVDPGAFATSTVIFRIPKTVPGTYSSDNYGQYLQDFEALDYKGNPLQFVKLDENSWSISNGTQLDKVRYWVNDTYDTENEVVDAVFSPAGTNIEKDSNFMLNLHGFVGYFDGFKEVPYAIHIKKPADLIATTTLSDQIDRKPDPLWDAFLANRYFEVIDNPIMYAKPNTESFEINGITVTLSLFSPNNVYKASDLKNRMLKMMEAQKKFLGDVDSTKEYNILLYLSDVNKRDAHGFGALEHHTSTVVVLPEAMDIGRLEQAMVDVVSHEFFHIVTPLSVHSKEIQYFDFNDPKMSQHLWMYEGTTEYFANLFQVQQGLISEEDFYERMLGKITNSKFYDDSMSFTEMSKNILEQPYEPNYANVYEKGALINMCLDIILREKSSGEKSMLWLMKELSKKYGTDVPFEDEVLFGEIVQMTYPEVETFFKEHVIGDTPIDYDVYFSKVGLATNDVEEPTGYFFDGQVPYMDVDVQNDSVVFIRENIELNSFFDDLKLQGGDIFKVINGQEINLESLRPIIGESFSWTPETVVSMTVERDGELVSVEGKVGQPVKKVKKIVPLENVDQKIIDLRKAWLKG